MFKKDYQKIHSSKYVFGYLEKNVERHIWLVCSPKSGSTWLSRIIQDLLKWKTVKLVPAFGNREQEVDLSTILAAGVKGDLFSPHLHCRYSDYTGSIIDAMGSKVILQTRNIYDTIVSFYDHIQKEGPTFPSGYMNQECWDQLDESSRYEYLVELVTPWYFNFYCSWYFSRHFQEEKVKLVTYEELKNNPVETVSKVLDFCDVSISKERIETSIEKGKKKNTRQNKGIIGRGDQLSDELKSKVKGYTKFYPGVDFSPMGI
ncbi:sulfotransferase domain-containing protein [Pleionea litopenaei]|uniref:Sulfotransferase domain-containing protein n=1 Tax=Pleionea litopenaei TaxID=3070815 RepID=A0AA51RTC2_9GAMM|nr:sulfotransferase domain-containing protein [Pleionea sp. HL-JVS1]WMS87288.1 sulfotransferase domain-containing protein [Pleionea sp. HL-JVS1]